MSKSTLTRRALVASTAAMPAAAVLGLPAAAEPAAPDPIFALIQDYCEAFDQHGAAIAAEDAFVETHKPSCASFTGRASEECIIRFHDQPEWADLDDRSTQACHDQADAPRKLCHTAPTTLAGLAAVLNLVISAHAGGDDILNTFADDDEEHDLGSELCVWPFFRTVLQSVEQMARAQS